MSRQGKTRRRLFFLLSVTLAIVALAGGGALLRLHFIHQRAFQGRTDGLAAMKRAEDAHAQGDDARAAGEYAHAMASLGQYLSRYPTDVEILLPYAKARRYVEEPNGKQLGQAISLFQRVLQSHPLPEGQNEAQNNLLDLYSLVGYNTEAISLATAILPPPDPKTRLILATSPTQIKALRVRTLALIRMQRLDKAADDANSLTASAPFNLDYRILEIEIMRNRGQQDRVEAYADDLAKKHPDDVRFVLLKSIAAELVGKHEAAVQLAGSLVKPPVPLPDADYTLALVRQLDALQLFGDAFKVLQQAAGGKPDAAMVQLWISRLFETNHLQMVIDQTQTLDPQTASVESLGMRALALARADRRPEAAKLLAAMDQRGPGNPVAANWAAALRAVTQSDAPDPVQTIGFLRAALAGNSANPILLEELGDAYAAAGADDLAMVTWVKAMRAAPVWSAPLVRISRALISQALAASIPDERTKLAQAGQQLAQAAFLRAPDDHDVLKNLAAIQVHGLPAGPSKAATELLDQIAKLKAQFPADWDLDFLQARVIAKTQKRDAAIEVIRSILAAHPAAPEHVLVSLAGLSESFKLDQEVACFEASEKAYGLTANLAFARALWLRNQQRGPEGLALLEKASAGHDDPLWRNAWASYLDLTGDPRAKKEWLALGEGNPKNVRIQKAVLSARSVQNEHDFLGKTLQRLTDLLGEESPTLQLSRARWLLQSPSADDAAKASILLSDIIRNASGHYSPDIVEAHWLLATYYLRPEINNVGGAIDQLTTASDLQPQRPDIAIELAELLHGRGDFARARQYIDRAVQSGNATAQDRHLAASLLAMESDYAAALAAHDKNPDDRTPDLVLAAIYLELKDYPKTDDICRKLMEKPDAATIDFCADFYASQNRPQDAQNALRLLDQMKLPSGQRELILARFAARHGSPDEAIKDFQAAVQAAPKAAAAWQQLVTLSMAAGKVDEALAAADQAAAKLGPATFAALRKNPALVKNAARVMEAHDLLMALTTDSPANSSIVDAMQVVLDTQQQKEMILKNAQQQKETILKNGPKQKELPEQTAAKVRQLSKQTAVKLRQLADQNPHTLPLQTCTLQFYIDAQQTPEAADIATRIVQNFPGNADSLRVATNVMVIAGKWDQALATAKEWRRVAAGDPLDADLAIARSELNLGDAAAASGQIQPYLARATADPEKLGGVIVLQAEALVAGHHSDQAEALLRPLLTKSAQWRELWISLAAGGLGQPSRAQVWLDQVASLVANDPQEKTHLADAWMRLGKQSKNPEFEVKGRKMLEAIVQAPDAPVEACLSWGRFCEAALDWSGAQRAYRQALNKAPKDADTVNDAVILNNLAFVLVKGRGDLAEALKCIDKALEIDPSQPAFLDTKATVQAAAKNYKAAIATLKDAQRIDPTNIKWRIQLLAVLLDAADADPAQIAVAQNEMQQIKAAISAQAEISPEFRQLFDLLSTRLKTKLQANIQ